MGFTLKLAFFLFAFKLSLSVAEARTSVTNSTEPPVEVIPGVYATTGVNFSSLVTNNGIKLSDKAVNYCFQEDIYLVSNPGVICDNPHQTHKQLMKEANSTDTQILREILLTLLDRIVDNGICNSSVIDGKLSKCTAIIAEINSMSVKENVYGLREYIEHLEFLQREKLIIGEEGPLQEARAKLHVLENAQALAEENGRICRGEIAKMCNDRKNLDNPWNGVIPEPCMRLGVKFEKPGGTLRQLCVFNGIEDVSKGPVQGRGKYCGYSCQIAGCFLNKCD